MTPEEQKEHDAAYRDAYDAEYAAAVQEERERCVAILSAAGADDDLRRIAASAIAQGLSAEQGKALIGAARREH
jgi:hypothetical protein